MADFFDKTEAKETTVDNQTQTDTKVKIGEREFSQEELNRRIGLSDIALEAEEKYSTKIDRVWPEFTKSRQELAKVNTELEEWKNKPAPVVETKGALSEEEKLVARKQLFDLIGDEPVKKKDFDTAVNKTVANFLAAKDLSEGIDRAIGEVKETYGIETNRDAVFDHMQETGFKVPIKAIKDMFEPQIDKWKEEQINKVKQPGFNTQAASTAGSKQPQITVPKNDTQLKESLSAFFRSRGGGEN